MKNVDIKIEGSNAVITIDLEANHGESGSKKSIVVASTEGNQDISYARKDGKIVKLGLNAYVKK